jgi:hypothetical protein
MGRRRILQLPGGPSSARVGHSANRCRPAKCTAWLLAPTHPIYPRRPHERQLTPLIFASIPPRRSSSGPKGSRTGVTQRLARRGRSENCCRELWSDARQLGCRHSVGELAGPAPGLRAAMPPVSAVASASAITPPLLMCLTIESSLDGHLLCIQGPLHEYKECSAYNQYEGKNRGGLQTEVECI